MFRYGRHRLARYVFYIPAVRRIGFARHMMGMAVMDFDFERHQMVEAQLRRRGIRDENVLEGMSRIPRHLFVPPDSMERAYGDYPLSIGGDQTISQPYMVALMTEALAVNSESKVLELGTGSGYQAAVLSLLVRVVFTIERLAPLAEQAEEKLHKLGYTNIRVVVGDGTSGLEEEAPFDGIIVTAAAPDIPEPLVDQLADGGRLVIPVGSRSSQKLVALVKKGKKVTTEDLTGCVFVPLVGKHGWKD